MSVSTEDVLAALCLRWLFCDEAPGELLPEPVDCLPAGLGHAGEEVRRQFCGLPISFMASLERAIAAVEARLEVEQAREKVLEQVATLAHQYFDEDRYDVMQTTLMSLASAHYAYQAALARSSP